MTWCSVKALGQLYLLLLPFYGSWGKKGWEGMDWIHLAQKRNQWLAVVKTVMNLRVP
jgi:hypothetical protein